MWTSGCELCSLVGDGGFLCGGLKPPLAVGASQISQWAPLFKPSAQACLDVAVHVPGKEMIVHISREHIHIDTVCKSVRWR